VTRLGNVNTVQTVFGLRAIANMRESLYKSNALLSYCTLPVIGWAAVHPTPWSRQRVMDLAVAVTVVVLVFMVLLQL
jgi:low affinity Fe/Cu permease